MDEYSQQEPPGQEEAASEAGLFEDLIDVFVSPSAVFERHRDGRFWGLFFTLVVLTAVLAYAAASAIGPVLQMEAIRVLANNPNVEAGTQPPGFMTNPVLQGGVTLIGSAIGLFVFGLIVLIVGKIFGGKLGFGSAMAVAVLASFPRLLTPLAELIQSFFVDLNAVAARVQLSLGPARFLDPEAASSAVRATIGRLDLTVLWATVLLAIGFAVTAHMSRGKAAAAAAVIWLAGTAFAVVASGLSGV